VSFVLQQANAATNMVCGSLPRRVSAAKLLEINDALCDAMGASIGGYDAGSYNVLLTLQHLIYVPRSRESSGPVDVNALVSKSLSG